MVARLIELAEKIEGAMGEDPTARAWANELRRIAASLSKQAGIVREMLELGDQRLLASDGPAGKQLPDLSPQEWGNVYRACKAIGRAA